MNVFLESKENNCESFSIDNENYFVIPQVNSFFVEDVLSCQKNHATIADEEALQGETLKAFLNDCRNTFANKKVFGVKISTIHNLTSFFYVNSLKMTPKLYNSLDNVRGYPLCKKNKNTCSSSSITVLLSFLILMVLTSVLVIVVGYKKRVCALHLEIFFF